MGQVGSIFSDYRLNLQGFDRDIDTIFRKRADMERRLAAQAQGVSTRVAPAIVAQHQQAATAAGMTAAAELRLATARARGQTAAGNYTGAITTLTNALARQTTTTTQTVNATNQLEAAKRKLHASTQSNVSGMDQLRNALGGLTRAFGALGFAIGLNFIVNFAKEAINAANQLEKVESTVRALSGSQQKYNEVLNLARQGQRNFGGSLADTLEGLGSLVNLSNRSNVSLEHLNNVSRRLALVDPLQGLKGASIALKEFLTGSDQTAILSLVRRFELPRSAIRDLTDETLTAQQKLEGLDKVLADQGITMDVLTARTLTTAVTYDRMGSSLDNARVAIGAWLAQGLQPAAAGLDVLANKAFENITQLNSLSDRFAALTGHILTATGTYQQYAQQVQFINSQLPFWAGKLAELTPAQFAFAQSLMRTGMTAQEASIAIAKVESTSRTLQGVFDTLGATTTDVGRHFGSLMQPMLEIAISSPEAAAGIANLALALQDELITGEQFRIVVLAQVDALRQQKEAADLAAAAEAHRHGEQSAGITDTQASTDAHTKNSEALVESTTKAVEAELAAQRLTNAQALLAALGGQVAAGQMEAGRGALIFAAGADVASDAAIRLINLQAQLALAKMPGGQGGTAGLTYSTVNERARSTGAQGVDQLRQNTVILDLHTKRVNEARLAEAEYQKSLGNMGPILAYYRSQLNSVREGSARYYEIVEKITDLEAGGKKGGGAGGGAGAARLKAQGKVLDQLEDQEIKFYNKMQDAADEHAQRMIDIEARYWADRVKAERKFHQQSLDSRADFYDSLAGIEDQGLRKALSEKYEQVQQDVARIREKHGADAAADYEREATERLTAETRLIDQINKLRSKKDAEGEDKSKEQREKDAAEAEYLEGVLALKQAANAERLRQIEEDGSAIEADKTKAIADEAARYTDAQDQIINSSDRATDKIALNAERRKLAIDAENASLARTREHYDALQGPGGSPTATVPSTAPAQGIAPPNTAIGTTRWETHDQGVIDILTTTNTILNDGFRQLVEGTTRLIERVTRVENAITNLSGAVQ